MGDASSVDLARNRAIGSLEKAIEKSPFGKKDKLREAVTGVKEAMSHAAKIQPANSAQQGG